MPLWHHPSFVRSTFEGMENMGKTHAIQAQTMDAILESHSESVFGLSTNSACGQYTRACSVYRRTIGHKDHQHSKDHRTKDHQYISEFHEDVLYTEGYHEYAGGGQYTWKNIMSTVGDTMSTLGVVQHKGVSI